MVITLRALIGCGIMMMVSAPVGSFVITPASTPRARLFVSAGRSCQGSASSTPLAAYGKYGDGRSSSRYGSKERSKRQERVGHLVRTELAQIIHRGYPVKYADPIDDELLKRINIVNVNCSPDLRNARVTVSVTGKGDTSTVDKRRAYSWLVRHSKMIRHAMAQRLSHMKTVPDLTFVQVDVGAAVDVMHLIDKVSEGGYKREHVGMFGGDDDALPRGMTLETDFDDEDEDDGWIDFDDEEDDFEDEEKKP